MKQLKPPKVSPKPKRNKDDDGETYEVGVARSMKAASLKGVRFASEVGKTKC